MRKTTLALATLASFAAGPALAQNAASSPLNSGNTNQPERAVPPGGDVSGGERNSNRSDNTGSVPGTGTGATSVTGSAPVAGTGGQSVPTAPGTTAPAR